MKVVIIEDKPLIRRAIVETLDWQALNCELAASAGDGLEGKRVIEQHHPDIIITDIRMPDMDGLQLAEFAMDYLDSVKVIVITGYQDFDYAKQCVRLGVTEYLLKPLNNAELEATVTKAVGELTQERQAEQEKQQLVLTAKRQTIWELLFGEKGQLHNEAASHSPKLNAHRYGLIVLKQSSTAQPDVEPSARNAQEKALASCNRVLLAVEHMESCEAYQFNQHNEIVYVYLFSQKMSEQGITSTLNERLLKVKHLLAESTERGCHFMGSFPIRSIENLREQYIDISSKLRRYFFNLEHHQELNHVKLSILHELEQFQSYLSTDTPDEMYARIQPYLTSISTYAAGNVTVAKALVYELCLTIAKHYYKKSNNERIRGQSVEEILNHVNTLDDMTQAESYVRSLLDVFGEQEALEASHYGSLVKAVLRYIDDNYRNEISLQAVAEHFHISAGHLSRLFRKEVGASFVDMVTRTRIQAAKQLMRDPSKRIAEISEQTGFKNYVYFYQVFKKYEKISPQEYKNKL